MYTMFQRKIGKTISKINVDKVDICVCQTELKNRKLSQGKKKTK